MRQNARQNFLQKIRFFEMAKKEVKPKSNRTLRKMVLDMKAHCEAVSRNEFFGCHTCAYNVFFLRELRSVTLNIQAGNGRATGN